MKVIVTCRGGGKTSRLIRMSAQTGQYIVCGNPHDVQHKAKEMDMNIPFPLTYEEFIEKKYYAKGVKGFLIDNAEHLIVRMTHVPIAAITLSIDDE